MNRTVSMWLMWVVIGLSMGTMQCGKPEPSVRKQEPVATRKPEPTLSRNQPIDAVNADIAKQIEAFKSRFDDLNARTKILDEKQAKMAAGTRVELEAVFLKLQDKQNSAASLLTDLKAAPEERRNDIMQNVRLALSEFQEMVESCESLAAKDKS